MVLVDRYGTGNVIKAGRPKAPRAALRPGVDSHHLFVYNCDDAPGASFLHDSSIDVSVDDMPFNPAFTEGIQYSLQQTYGGSVYPFLLSNLDGEGSGAAAAVAPVSFTSSAITVECVAAVMTLPTLDATFGRPLVWAHNGTMSCYVYLGIINGVGGVPGIFGIIGGSGLRGTTYTLPHTIAAGVIHHFQFEYIMDGGGSGTPAAKMYVDGVDVSAAVATTYNQPVDWTLLTICGSDVTIGDATTNAYIRDVRISDVARGGTYAAAMTEALKVPIP